MPPKPLIPNQGAANIDTSQLKNINFDYDYPEGLDLHPGDKQHDEIVSMVLRHANTAHGAMSSRHDDWTEIDKVLKSYSYNAPTGGLKQKKGKDADGDVADRHRRIIMPVSFVVLETLLTYMSTVFFRSPTFQFSGTGPEDVLGSILLEEVIEQQIHRNGVQLNLHTSWRDMFAYGVGYASPRWEKKMGRVMLNQEKGFLDPIKGLFFETGRERVESGYQIISEGNQLDNIDPYLALPDPNVSPHEIQESEFFGWVDETVYSSLRRKEAGSDGSMFNVKYLKHIIDRGGTATSHIRNKGERNRRTDLTGQDSSSPVHVIWMYIDLIPSEHDLSDKDDPETWVFAVGGDSILLKAEPLGLVHGRIPVAAGAPDYDGYSVAPMSRLLAIEELQMLVDFLYTSHIENIKRVINDNIVVDPSLINIHDVNDNRPGKTIRVLKKGWGQSNLRDNAIFQLDVKDATQQNVQEALFLMDQAKVATSTMDQLQGNLQPRTSRVSAAEAKGLRSAGLNRLERPAVLISHQFMLPIARMFASNVQQFMENDTFIKATGELKQRLQSDFNRQVRNDRTSVKPIDLVVDFDVVAHDGAVPGKSDLQVWTDLFQTLAQQPQLAQQFDMVRILKHIARESGAKNVDEFVKQQQVQPQGQNGRVQVLPDEQVAREAERGNIEPI